MAPALPTGLDALDDEIGGLPTGTLVQVHGPPAAGKTSLALTVASRLRPATLILPEPIHPRRMAAILSTPDDVLIRRPPSLDDQDEAVVRAAKLLRTGRTRLVVLDSLTHLYRFEQMADTEALQRLYRQLNHLAQAARASGGIALFTNQVRGAPEGYRPIGGPAVAHASEAILSLQHLDGSWRRLRVERHPYHAPGASWDLRIGGQGIA